MEELLQDLTGTAWDAVLISETWREEKAKCYQLSAGHVFIICGGEQKKNRKGWKHGVGILIHKKWATSWTNSTPVSARVYWVDLAVMGV